MNIYLINHTEVYNPNHICYGQTEMPLTENFTNKFSAIQETLKLDYHTTDFFSSPLRRCTKLASFLSDNHFTTNDNLLELNYGDWESEEWKDIDKNLLSEWHYTPALFKFPNGESLQEAKARVLKGYKETLKSKKENVVIVCHSSTIKLIIAFVLGLNIKNIDKLSSDFGSVHQIEFDRAGKGQKLVYSNLVL